ncbi:MAG TPA: monofunctional biosynthetic peptidoglycan transglycosylase [Caulobacteraceae bacterium]|jgi:monofunctional biosynthetic peptidoglycan transglycosylase|nr:monofunctional biosynthetic peptidoglycan transglycosylase [Caulobacteraceae bacterium]
MAKGPARPRGFRWGRLLRNLFLALLLVLVVAPVAAVAVYRFVPPPLTILMVERMAAGQGLDHQWRPLADMSPALPRAAIAAEDARFCEHHGFDFTAIDKALQHDDHDPSHIRGGSTISQQTAKNVFLWPDRSWVRKGFEAYFTVLIETIWGKRRIMEVYLNTVEMGPGVYGVEAAAEHYFHVSAKDVNAFQAARLIAILPSPLKWQAVDPGPYVRRRSGRIDAGEGTVRRDGGAECIS